MTICWLLLLLFHDANVRTFKNIYIKKENEKKKKKKKKKNAILFLARKFSLNMQFSS